jgi:hypothetical protein
MLIYVEMVFAFISNSKRPSLQCCATQEVCGQAILPFPIYIFPETVPTVFPAILCALLQQLLTEYQLGALSCRDSDRAEQS